MSLALLALLPWLGAVLVACLPVGTGGPAARRAAALMAGAIALLATGLVLASAPAVFAGEVLRVGVPWVPALGLDLGFRMDGLA